jgi:hypothetical protein
MAIPTKISARIDYWESNELSKMTSKKTKTYKETIKKLGYLIDSRYMFEGMTHTMPDFRLAVDRFALKALNPEYQPIKKKVLRNLPLHLFLYNPFSLPDMRSEYKMCLESKPLPVSVRNPASFNLLANSYVKFIRNGVKTIEDLSAKDHYNLGWAANKIDYFCKNNLSKVDTTMAGTKKKIITAFLEASKSFVKNDLTRFDTHLLTRKWVWEKFPNYLQNNGYLKEERPWTMDTWRP